MSQAAPTRGGSVGTPRGLRTVGTALAAAVIASALTLAVVNATDSPEEATEEVSRVVTSDSRGDVKDDRELNGLMRSARGGGPGIVDSRPPGGGPQP